MKKIGSLQFFEDVNLHLDFDFNDIREECILSDMDNDEGENNPHPYLKLKVNARDTEYKGKIHKNLLSFGGYYGPASNPTKMVLF